MFKKETLKSNDIESLISAGMNIKGDIESKSSLRVDGKIDGNIKIQGDLIVGKEGYIKGIIQANNIMLAGRCEGDIEAVNKLVINTSGILHGDVSCQLILIEEGGILDGNCKMHTKLGLITNNDNEKKISKKK